MKIRKVKILLIDKKLSVSVCVSKGLRQKGTIYRIKNENDIVNSAFLLKQHNDDAVPV